jgi:broad specificity phosphatase PhoE
MKIVRPTSLFLVRHGQTEWNKIKKVQGQLDIPLSDEGIAQAQLVARYLAQHKFDAIISSDLQRAFHTATIINTHHQHSIIIEPLLREQHYGIAQGLMRDEVPQKFPLMIHKIHNQIDPEYHVPEAESYAQLVDRVVKAMELIVNTHAGKKVLIVAHANLMRALIRHCLRNHQLPLSIENCAIARLSYSDSLTFEQFDVGGSLGLQEEL